MAIQPIITASQPSKPSSQPTLVKLVTFEVGKLSLAVPIDQVQKVVNLPKIYGSGLNPVGLAQIDNRDIIVIDLHQRLFKSEAVQTNAENYYLILIQAREVIGIPVAETPLLLEVPATLIRLLPESYRRADTLNIASHIAIVPEAEGSRTLFLLDVAMLSR